MNNQYANATKRLGLVGDIGFSIFTETANSDLELLVSTHGPQWTSESIREWKDAKHPFIEWISSNIGAIPATEVEGGDSLPSGSERTNNTLISEFYLGARVGVVLSHKSDALTEVQINEARAAALVIQAMQPNEKELGITAKELIYLKQVSAGASDDEIATDLQLSLRAVKERKRKAIDDLHAKSIAHAIGIAKRANLI